MPYSRQAPCPDTSGRSSRCTSSRASLTLRNAEYIAFYPNMPGWLTREKVYLAWLGITCVGVSGLAVFRFGLPALGAALVGAYGAFGLDGLAHYTLALCSEHTLATNITIWSEAGTGLLLLLFSAVLLGRRLRDAG